MGLGLIKNTDLTLAESSAALSESQDNVDDSQANPEQQLLFEMQGCSTKNQFAISTPPGKPVPREGRRELGEFGKVGDIAQLVISGNQLAILKGFSLPAATS